MARHTQMKTTWRQRRAVIEAKKKHNISFWYLTLFQSKNCFMFVFNFLHSNSSEPLETKKVNKSKSCVILARLRDLHCNRMKPANCPCETKQYLEKKCFNYLFFLENDIPLEKGDFWIACVFRSWNRNQMIGHAHTHALMAAIDKLQNNFPH